MYTLKESMLSPYVNQFTFVNLFIFKLKYLHIDTSFFFVQYNHMENSISMQIARLICMLFWEMIARNFFLNCHFTLQQIGYLF